MTKEECIKENKEHCLCNYIGYKRSINKGICRCCRCGHVETIAWADALKNGVDPF